MIIIVLNYGGVGVFLDFFDFNVLDFGDGDLRVVVSVFLFVAFVFGDFGDDGDG